MLLLTPGLAFISVFIFGGSYLLYKGTNVPIPIRVNATHEADGLGLSQHGETVLPAPHEALLFEPLLMMRA